MILLNSFITGLFPYKCCLCNQDLKHELKTKNKQLNRLCEKCCLDLLQNTSLKRFHAKVENLEADQKIGQFFYFWNFENYAETLIKKYKFGRNYRLAELFAEFAFICLRNFNILNTTTDQGSSCAKDSDSKVELAAWDYICHVPSAPSSIKRKRFNHAQMLANALSKRIRIDTSRNALSASRERKSQSELNKSSRLKNIAGAFSAAPEIVRNRKVLLIDDITTTGATIAECCKTLYEAGARQVDVITLAKRELFEI